MLQVETQVEAQVETLGDAGPELVLLHGWGSSSLVWEPVLSWLSRSFRLTLINLPLELSQEQGDPGQLLPQLVDRLLAVAPERAIWLGWSLGGQLALAVAQAAPHRVAGLVGVASNPCFILREDWSDALDEALFVQFEDALAADAHKTLKRFVLLQAQGSENQRREVIQLMTALSTADSNTLACLLGLLRLDMREALKTLQVPSLYMLGQHDLLVPVALADQLSRLRPDAQILIQEGAAHAPFLTRPEAFTQQVMTWARQISI
ncbi:alpha/beta fold hydrolase [Nitrincola alkalilacustris]|uniref:alpha/beta fold hydrolase n=1 Tax=Nitrincola alkalilacustris TaxID=1571224 RepID=UPI00124E37EC|nr:alpha/beta fold hydrolase [Nitrincola alkalilacustris]